MFFRSSTPCCRTVAQVHLVCSSWPPVDILNLAFGCCSCLVPGSPKTNPLRCIWEVLVGYKDFQTSISELLTQGISNPSHPHIWGILLILCTLQWSISVCVCVCVCMLSCFSHFQLSVALWTVAHQAPCPLDFPGKNTRVGCHFLPQGIFPTQESNLRLLH